jgi:hypothetical protein
VKNELYVNDDFMAMPSPCNTGFQYLLSWRRECGQSIDERTFFRIEQGSRKQRALFFIFISPKMSGLCGVESSSRRRRVRSYLDGQ